jgi:hypothetical protein
MPPIKAASPIAVAAAVSVRRLSGAEREMTQAAQLCGANLARKRVETMGGSKWVAASRMPLASAMIVPTCAPRLANGPTGARQLR